MLQYTLLPYDSIVFKGRILALRNSFECFAGLHFMKFSLVVFEKSGKRDDKVSVDLAYPNKEDSKKME